MEDEEDLAGSGIPIAGGTQSESIAVEEDATAQEKDPAMPQVPAVEGAQTNVEVDGSGEKAAGQREHL